MAQYKVPQDVEAEDRLLGPFTFRQFIYLIVSIASLAICWGLFQLFPLLGLIPLPIAILFGVLALPLKKDQPMETYLVAIVSFHLKNRKRLWTPGQKESSILITAPKIVEKPRTRNITEEEAGHRLSFLADLIDTEGYSIKNGSSSMREEYAMEANNVVDILDGSTGSVFDKMIAQEQNARHAQLVSQMRSAIANQNQAPPTIHHNQTTISSTNANYSIPTYQTPPPPTYNQYQQTYQPYQPTHFTPQQNPGVQPAYPSQPNYQPTPPQVDPNLTNLANNPIYSVETIQKEANRIQNQGNNNEVFISLH